MGIKRKETMVKVGYSEMACDNCGAEHGREDMRFPEPHVALTVDQLNHLHNSDINPYTHSKGWERVTLPSSGKPVSVYFCPDCTKLLPGLITKGLQHCEP